MTGPGSLAITAGNLFIICHICISLLISFPQKRVGLYLFIGHRYVALGSTLVVSSVEIVCELVI